VREVRIILQIMHCFIIENDVQAPILSEAINKILHFFSEMT